MRMPPSTTLDTSRARRLAMMIAAVSTAIGFVYPLGAQQQPAATCKVTGKATAGSAPLPGVSVVALNGQNVVAATSSDLDGSYQLALAPGTYQLKADLTGFVTFQQALTLEGEPCTQAVALPLALAPRTPRAATAAQASPAGRGRFETLNIETQQAGAVADAQPERDISDAATRALLPPGFSTEAPTESLAVTGNMASIDRGMMGDRMQAIMRGEFDPTTGEFGQGFGPQRGGGPGGPGGFGGPGGGRGEGLGRGGPGGGRGGPGDFVIGGRGGRQNAYNFQANYTYNGSALDSDPYPLRGSTQTKRPYNRSAFGFTVGGPVKLPGIYDGARRTTFNASYNGNRGDQLYDQYGTVPTDAMRSGDFSAVPVQLVDPLTGEPFLDNQIPLARMDPGALSLLRFIPSPNVEGSGRNFHRLTTTNSVADNVNIRVTHTFVQPAGRGGAGGRGAPGGRGGGGGRAGGPGGRGGRGNQGTTVTMNAQFQYRRNDNQQNNLFPTLGGNSQGSSLSTPVSLNITRRRTLHNVNVNFSRTTSEALGRYAYVADVAGAAGITGVATDPFTWGVPTLNFSSFSSARDVSPSIRHDERWMFGYTWTQPWRTHTIRAGGDFRIDRASSRTDSNPRGTFVFTGLYSSGGSNAARGGGLDIADFLLGMPQQAILAYGPGNVVNDGRSFSLFLQDDWRKNAALTFNIGLRYEFLRPFEEDERRMVNLDVPADFTAAVPVMPGDVGPFTGAFPSTLMNADINNVAPRVGFAWRAAQGTIVRGGYGVSYNAGSYAAISRQMVSQPPFATTDTRLGTAEAPLLLTNAFPGSSGDTTTNNFGVDKDYALGVVQTWNGDLSRDLRQVWNIGGGYTYTRGANLDIVRAPNRGPSGLRIEGVQPFVWQSSEGGSELHAGTFRLRRRPAKGVGFGASYTIAKSRDNASTIGGGGTVVAQDDQNLAAEWGLSTFDRRHQFAADVNVEFPFGQNRPWLNQGGFWAALLENWRMSATFNWQSGTPYTPRVQAAAADVARGTSNSLRANYNGQEIQVNDPTIDLFFNTAAFSVPPAGTFGTASRNMIIGPGSRLLDAQVSRDIRLGRTRAVTFQLNASNLLNMVNYSGIDTVVNSPTFGQVVSVRPMRSMQASFRFRF